MKRNFAFLGLIVAITGAGCSDNSIESIDNTGDAIEQDMNDLGESVDGKADAVSSQYTYYTVRPDLRRCVSPLCGGVFVARVNQSSTRCADGTYASECYVAGLDTSRLGLSADGAVELRSQINAKRVLLRGWVRAKTYSSFGNLGEFVTQEAWNSTNDSKATGIFYRVNLSGVRCFTFPCPSYKEAKLNSTTKRSIAGLSLDKVKATEDNVIAAFAQLQDNTNGLLVSGSHTTVTGPAGSAWALKATQFWLPFRATPTAKKCFVGGCSGQVCSSNEGVITTCEWRPEYACYDSATCEVQANGECGWTQTASLTQCLANN